MDTIFALASARGKSGVAVVRVSGPSAFEVSSELGGSLPVAGSFGLRRLRGSDGGILDEALVLVFPKGKSFTGEETVEFHVHGSRAIISAVLDHLSAQDGLREADAGEFTRRALENDRLDFGQVEGLADLIDAETELQREQAMGAFQGRLANTVASWREDLIRASALVTAVIDFVDEDVPVDVTPEVKDLLSGVLASLVAEKRGARFAERLRDGFEVAIVGAPNAGKSTLLNYLAGRNAAITSEIAGTTRDVIEVRMDLQGVPVTFLDTAGLREGQDPVEAVGIDRTKERAEAADLRVFLRSSPDEVFSVSRKDGDYVVFAKADVVDDLPALSGKTGEGVAAMVEHIVHELSGRAAHAKAVIGPRQCAAIDRAAENVEASLKEVAYGEDRLELAAEALRAAIVALDSLVGRVDVEHILDEIFSRFCIGK